MSQAIVVEAHFYLSSFLWGMILVALYDVLRIFRRIIPHGLLWIGLEDLLFWTGGAVLIFQMIFENNNGTIRIPGIIITVVGMTAYHYIISNPFINFLNRWIILPVKKFIGFLWRGLKKALKKVKIFLQKLNKREKNE